MKKAFVVVLVLFAIAVLVSCIAPEASKSDAGGMPQIPNPVVTLQSADEFAQINIYIDAPEGATDVSYSVISETLAQVCYTHGGREWTLRASRTGAQTDITGVYAEFDADIPVKADGEDFSMQYTVKTISGGEQGAAALATAGGTDYSLYTADKVDAETIGNAFFDAVRSAFKAS